MKKAVHVCFSSWWMGWDGWTREEKLGKERETPKNQTEFSLWVFAGSEEHDGDLVSPLITPHLGRRGGFVWSKKVFRIATPSPNVANLCIRIYITEQCSARSNDGVTSCSCGCVCSWCAPE